MKFDLLNYIALGLTAVTSIQGAFLERRRELPHLSVKEFPEKVQNHPMGKLILKHKPKLHVNSGCVPFAAVDKWGNTK